MRVITTCRSCESTDLVEIFSLGEQYVSDFREDDSKPNKYPLDSVICKSCYLVQLRHTTPSGDMYHENYGFKSNISNSIKDDLKDNVEHVLEFIKPTAWLDIASNDGTLLSYVDKKVFRIGVDPITKLCEEAREYADAIINDFFPSAHFPEIKVDAITSISCFYDMDRPNEFVSGVVDVMHDKTVWDIQQNYLLPTMQLNAIDNFCHEHLEYYTLLSLEPLLARHGLEVIDVKTTMVNGGSIRTIVAKKGAYEPRASVQEQRDIETAAKLDEVETYIKFGTVALSKVHELKELVDGLVKDGKRVAILAASTRGSTIWQACGFNETNIVYAIERNPAKVGRYFSAIGVPIVSEEFAREDKPDAEVIGPWFFAFPEIVSREAEYVKSGGQLIVPLPEVVVVTEENIDEYLKDR